MVCWTATDKSLIVVANAAGLVFSKISSKSAPEVLLCNGIEMVCAKAVANSKVAKSIPVKPRIATNSVGLI